MRVVIITPVRNEGRHIGTTVRCMVGQTHKPVKWIVVDDGSTDETGRIVQEGTAGRSFVEYVSLPDRGCRKPAEGVIESFNRGLAEIGDLEYDIVSKFDGDLEFPDDTIERICKAFRDDPELGVTGGTRFERIRDSGPLKEVIVPEGFVSGACKFYRKKCFEEIGGLISRSGWDGVDTIRAGMKGWKTGQIDSLKIIHLKPTGRAEGEGLKKAGLKYGNTSRYMGGYFWHFLLHAAKQVVFNRSPRIGYYMLKGYFRALAGGEETESPEFRKALKKQQRRNAVQWLKRLWGRGRGS